MARTLFTALAATAALAFSASAANATVFTLDAINVTAHTPGSGPGLEVNIINHITSPVTFDLAAPGMDPYTFALFTIWTPETSLNTDNGFEDFQARPISLGFDFSAPGPNGDVDPIPGQTNGELGTGLFLGFIPWITQQGSLNWQNGGEASFTWGLPGNKGLMTISVNGGEFNEGFFGPTGGAGKGLTVYGTFDWDFDPAPTAAVPEPATWALMIGGFGLAGAALRRRRTLATAA